jgi:hypothetical protein
MPVTVNDSAKVDVKVTLDGRAIAAAVQTYITRDNAPSTVRAAMTVAPGKPTRITGCIEESGGLRTSMRLPISAQLL